MAGLLRNQLTLSCGNLATSLSSWNVNLPENFLVKALQFNLPSLKAICTSKL